MPRDIDRPRSRSAPMTMDSKLTDPATGKEIRLTSYAACAG
jgi:hypothetical protein